MSPPNLFDQLREIKLRQPLEIARQLTKVQHCLLAAEDLVNAVESLQLPKDFFLENVGVKAIIEASDKLKKTFEL